jgi:hypothetical protein
LTLTLSLILAAATAALPAPEPGTLPSSPADFSLVQSLALRKAGAEWPQAVPGPVVPYLDPSGATIAYMFHFTTDGRTWPGFEKAAADIREEAGRLTPNVDLTSWTSRYGYVLVSASYDQAPVLTFGYGTSDYCAVGQELMQRAMERLDDIAGLRVYFVFPCNYFEFESSTGERLVLASQSGHEWESREAFATEFLDRRAELDREYGVDPKLGAKLHREQWNQALESGFDDFTDVFVPGAELAPFYDWSYGCTPTAAAMLMGYIDRTQDYGKLVDWFWQRYDMVEGEIDWQIPNVQRECARAMHTDTTSGGTSVLWISPGLRQVAADNGYEFLMTYQEGRPSNDWAWATIVQEIDNGYAHVWSALWARHSLTALGYRTPGKQVYVHNTWWKPAAWWDYSGDGTSHVDSPHPTGGNPKKLIITHPMGDTAYNSSGKGELLQVGDTCNITWNNFGNPGTSVQIDLSTDGGQDWTILLGSTPDDGQYEWYIDPSNQKCDSCRLRLIQYDGFAVTSGDGTYGTFRLLREPLAPYQKAPPNGLQLFEGPVILEIESLPGNADSLEYMVVQGLDTIYNELSTVLTCSVPDHILRYRANHKWYVRARNQYGWGEFGTPWSFWVRFETGVEEQEDMEVTEVLRLKTLNHIGENVLFSAKSAGPDARLEIYDAAGIKVREFVVGERVVWDGRDASGRMVRSGLFFARLRAGTVTETRRFAMVE